MVERDPEPELSAAFRALADPSRRRILGLLREAGELRVSDIATAFDMSLNGVSKHLKALERAGLLKRRVEGRTHYLSADWEALRRPFEWLDFHRQFWAGRLDALAAHFNDPSEETDR